MRDAVAALPDEVTARRAAEELANTDGSGVAVLFDKKLFGCVYEAVLERVVRLGLFQLTVEEAFYRSGVNVFCACCEYYRLTALHRQLEVSGSEQILFVV